jgi:16S rRNA (adenine1518-N6/adenine1519-N6)-dimethyltransferase
MQNKKSLGQHWLRDRAILMSIAELAFADASGSGTLDAPDGINESGTARIASEAAISGYDQNRVTSPVTTGARNVSEGSNSRGAVLEIGPGLGTLTSALLRYFDTVTSIEFDPDLARKLPASFPGKNLTVINANFLDFPLDQSYDAIVGNIPYYITSPIIRHILSAPVLPKVAVLLIQKEVAERIAAPAGDHTILSVSTQAYAEVTLGPVVGRKLFTPPPKVDSQVIILRPRRHPLLTEEEIRFAKLAFSSPRKKITSTLPFALHLPREDIIEALSQVGLTPDARPADLNLTDWPKLRQILTK